MRSEGRDIDIGSMMDRWTLQMGYPVVTVSKNQSEQLPTHYITVTQAHFLYGQEVRSNNRQVRPRIRVEVVGCHLFKPRPLPEN